MENTSFLIHGGTVITSHREIPDGSVLVVDGVIKEVFESGASLPDVKRIDAKGQYISPGFIDLHIHGGGDSDFMEGTVDAYVNIARTHARYGTTGMFPTTLSGKWEDFIQALDVYEDAVEATADGAEFLGLHIEGPFWLIAR